MWGVLFEDCLCHPIYFVPINPPRNILNSSLSETTQLKDQPSLCFQITQTSGWYVRVSVSGSNVTTSIETYKLKRQVKGAFPYIYKHIHETQEYMIISDNNGTETEQIPLREEKIERQTAVISPFCSLWAGTVRGPKPVLGFPSIGSKLFWGYSRESWFFVPPGFNFKNVLPFSPHLFQGHIP